MSTDESSRPEQGRAVRLVAPEEVVQSYRKGPWPVDAVVHAVVQPGELADWEREAR